MFELGVAINVVRLRELSARTDRPPSVDELEPAALQAWGEGAADECQAFCVGNSAPGAGVPPHTPAMNRRLAAWPCAVLLVTSLGQAQESTPAAVVIPTGGSPFLRLAAREIRRYVWLRTDALPSIVERVPDAGAAIVLAVDPELGSEVYRLHTRSVDGALQLAIEGGSDRAVLYGAYTFAEYLGVRFALHGDSLPDALIPFALPELDETHAPLFDTRGLQPFHDFPEGPDWWTLDDYRALVAQMAKLRMNLIGLHCYPEGFVGPEPLVWIGTQGEVRDDGTVEASYQSRWASTSVGSWGYAPVATSDFAAGASLLFAADDHGATVTDGHRPLPRTVDDCNAVFDRAGRFLDAAFRFARTLGVRACIGTETPLRVPSAVAARLRERGLDPADPATTRALYRGMFQRIARTHPLDFYWLWTPEGWTWGGNDPVQLEATLADIAAAAQALDDLGHPFTLATCGWVLGPQQDRAALDRHLPQGSPVSCIDREVGFAFVESAFARVDGRPKWAIPWLEDDPNLVGVQLWVGRTRRDAADAHAYGCTGLLGIHWRTRVLAPNVAALAKATWSQSGWNAAFGERVQLAPRTVDVRLGGNAAAYRSSAIAGTDLDPVYQTCRWAIDGYRIAVPDGRYAVTLMLCEVHYGELGKRVFGVKLGERQVAEHVDVFARVGKDRALDLRFDDVEVQGGELRIAFTPEVEYPFVAGIVIEGTDFTRRIDCGGDGWRDFEADLIEPGDVDPRGPRARDLPCADFYADWAGVEFGPDVAVPMAALFASLDGGEGDYSRDKARTSIPRPSDWIGGPGGIRPNPVPWEQERARYDFVDAMAALAPRVTGDGQRARFDAWLATFRHHRALGELGCTRGALDRIVAHIEGEPDAAERARLARDEALPVRLALARQWEEMTTHLLAAASTAGDLGTIANLEQHTRRTNHFLDAHDAKLGDWLGAPLPPAVSPRRDYTGPPRIVVPTVRSVITAGEALQLQVIVLDRALPADVTLRWRVLGDATDREVRATHVARGVYTLTLPPARGDVLVYAIRVQTTDGRTLHWPATAPHRGQTVTVVPQ